MSGAATAIDVIERRARWCAVGGDSLDALRALPDASIDAIVSDPPYASTGDAASVMKSRDGASAVPREVQFYEAWAREHLREWVRVLKPTGAAWFTCDWRGAMAFDLAAHKLRIKAPVVGVWDRGGLGMGHILRKTWEAFVVVPMLGFERKAADVPDLWRVEWTIAQRGHEHAAEKPETLFRKAVRLVSDPDAVILDPFAGSGTTGPSALAEGRRVILIERDDEYRDICTRRCEASTLGTNWRRPEQASLGGIQ